MSILKHRILIFLCLSRFFHVSCNALYYIGPRLLATTQAQHCFMSSDQNVQAQWATLLSLNSKWQSFHTLKCKVPTPSEAAYSYGSHSMTEMSTFCNLQLQLVQTGWKTIAIQSRNIRQHFISAQLKIDGPSKRLHRLQYVQTGMH